MVIWHFLVSFGACLLVGLLVAFDVYIEELSLATLGKPTGTEREEKRWGSDRNSRRLGFYFREQKRVPFDWVSLCSFYSME